MVGDHHTPDKRTQQMDVGGPSVGTACGSFMERQRIRVPGTGTVGFMMPPRTEMQASADVWRPEGFLSRPWLRDDAIVDLFQKPRCLKAPVWSTSDSIARSPNQFTGPAQFWLASPSPNCRARFSSSSIITSICSRTSPSSTCSAKARNREASLRRSLAVVTDGARTAGGCRARLLTGSLVLFR